MTSTVYLLVLNTALSPIVGSVPAPKLFKYWVGATPWLPVRYFRKTLMSPLKLVMLFPSDGKNEKTVICPLGPLNTSQVVPASLTPVVRGTGLPSAPHALEISQL